MEGMPLCPDTVWRMAVRRLITRINTAEWATRIAMMDARSDGARQAIAGRVTKKLEPLARMTQAGVEWSNPWASFARDAGVDDRQQLPTATAAPVRLGTIQFQKETKEIEESAGSNVSIIADRNALICRATLRLSVKTSGSNTLFFLQTRLDMRLTETKEGEFLPLEEAEKCNFEQLVLRAAREVHRAQTLIYGRPQLYKLAPGATNEAATDYLMDMKDAGIEAARQATIVSRTDSDHNIIQEARALMEQMKAKDIRELKGPRLSISQLQQPHRVY